MKNLSIPNCLLDTANCCSFQYTNSLTQVMKWKDKYNLLRHEPDIHPEKLSPEIVPACFFVKRSTKTESNHTTQNTVGSQKLIPIESMFVDGPKWKSSQEYPNNAWILGGMSWPNPKSRNSTLCYMNAKNETGKKVWIFIIKVMANDILFANVVFQLVIFKAEKSPFVFFLTKSIVPPPPLWPRTVPPAIAMMHKTPSAAKETGPQPVQKIPAMQAMLMSSVFNLCWIQLKMLNLHKFLSLQRMPWYHMPIAAAEMMKRVIVILKQHIWYVSTRVAGSKNNQRHAIT